MKSVNTVTAQSESMAQCEPLDPNQIRCCNGLTLIMTLEATNWKIVVHIFLVVYIFNLL